MARTKELKIVLLGMDVPSRRLARNLLEQHQNWNLAGEFPATERALESARFIRPDLLVLDRESLGEKPASFVSRVAASIPDARVLVLTRDCSEQEIRALLRAGATGLLAKSEIDTRFISAIKQAASGERYLSGRLARLVLHRFLESAVGNGNGAPLSDLTPREREIIRLIALGSGNKQVAAQLGIAVRTAEVHRANVMRKLNLHNVAELLHFAVSAGLIDVAAIGSNSR